MVLEWVHGVFHSTRLSSRYVTSLIVKKLYDLPSTFLLSRVKAGHLIPSVQVVQRSDLPPEEDDMSLGLFSKLISGAHHLNEFENAV